MEMEYMSAVLTVTRDKLGEKPILFKQSGTAHKERLCVEKHKMLFFYFNSLCLLMFNLRIS